MKPFKSILLAVSLLAYVGGVQARDDIDEITMRVMEDIVKEDKGRGVRYLELPPARASSRELRERDQGSRSGNTEQKKDGGSEHRGETERHPSKQSIERHDDERDSRYDRHEEGERDGDRKDDGDERYDDRYNNSDEGGIDHTSLMDGQSDERNSSTIETSDTHEVESVESH